MRWFCNPISTYHGTQILPVSNYTMLIMMIQHIPSFHKDFLNTDCVTSTFPGSGDIAENQTDKVPHQWSSWVSKGRNKRSKKLRGRDK